MEISKFLRGDYFLILTNLLLLSIVVFSGFIEVSVRNFFYITAILVAFFSFINFKYKKTLAASISILNLFIFFYFFSKNLLFYFSRILGEYMIIFSFLVLFSVVFSFFVATKNSKVISFSFKTLNPKVLLLVIFFAILFSLVFLFSGEPNPFYILKGVENNLNIILLSILVSIGVSVTEQTIFLGIFYTSYIKFFSHKVSSILTAFLFLVFHVVEFTFVLEYFKQAKDFFEFYFFLYLLFIFLFMLTSIYFYKLSYNEKTKEFKIMYSIILHFITNFLSLSVFLLF